MAKYKISQIWYIEADGECEALKEMVESHYNTLEIERDPVLYCDEFDDDEDFKIISAHPLVVKVNPKIERESCGLPSCDFYSLPLHYCVDCDCCVCPRGCLF